MSISPAENDWFSLLLDQSWVAFVILGVFLVGIKIYNMRQREEGRKLLTEAVKLELLCQQIRRSKAQSERGKKDA